MCVIYGLIQLHGSPADVSLLSALGGVTTHRGPDNEGVHASGPCAIGMRRLSIIDVGGGRQPISNADDTVWVVCNGEIDNFRELRRDLEARGSRLLLTDKMSMAASLECRVPLLDHELVEMVARMPEDIKVREGRLKHVMRQAVSTLLPHDILDRKKRGLARRWGAWLKADRSPLMTQLLSKTAIENRRTPADVSDELNAVLA